MSAQEGVDFCRNNGHERCRCDYCQDSRARDAVWRREWRAEWRARPDPAGLNRRPLAVVVDTERRVRGLRPCRPLARVAYRERWLVSWHSRDDQGRYL